MRLLPTLAAALTAAVSLSLVAAGPAQAKDGPPAPAPGTHLMLDIASAPPLSTIQAWQATSPYSAIAVYIPVDASVDDRHDKVQTNLTSPGWVAAVRAGGWQVLPIYLGLQAPSKCGNAAFRHLSNNATKAADQGRAAAEDAARSAQALGISPGAPIVYDMEAYASGCSKAMRSFYDAWTTRLHQLGERSGIYGSRASTMADVVALAGNGQASPDVVWAATGWGVAQTASIDPLPDGTWAGKRINQFNLSVSRKYGGIAMTIDESAVDDTVWDITPPSITLPNLPPTTKAAKVKFDWSGYDADSGVASYQIRTKDGALGKGLGHWSAPKTLAHSARKAKLSRGEQWCAQVRATDRAGNTSGWSATRCTSRLADDRVLSADRSWHRAKAKGAYAHTTTVARHKHATLRTKGKVKARSIGILFRGTGKVVVKIGGHKVGTVSGRGQVWLHLAKVHHGRLQLITQSKKKVAVDGIALLRQ